MPAAPSLARQILDQAFNQGNLSIVDELISVDATIHIPGWGLPANRLGLKQMIVNLRTAFADLYCTVDDEIEGESKSAALWTLRGSHQGSFLGNSPTGRLVAVQGFIFIRAADGQIAENWVLIDQMGLLQQLGIIPPPRGKI
jgi:predicted ester cyclase